MRLGIIGGRGGKFLMISFFFLSLEVLLFFFLSFSSGRGFHHGRARPQRSPRKRRHGIHRVSLTLFFLVVVVNGFCFELHRIIHSLVFETTLRGRVGESHRSPITTIRSRRRRQTFNRIVIDVFLFLDRRRFDRHRA